MRAQLILADCQKDRQSTHRLSYICAIIDVTEIRMKRNSQWTKAPQIRFPPHVPAHPTGQWRAYARESLTLPEIGMFAGTRSRLASVWACCWRKNWEMIRAGALGAHCLSWVRCRPFQSCWGFWEGRRPETFPILSDLFSAVSAFPASPGRGKFSHRSPAWSAHSRSRRPHAGPAGLPQTRRFVQCRQRLHTGS